MCVVTAGFLVGCKNTMGGVKRLLVLPTAPLTPTIVAEEITAFASGTAIEFRVDQGEAGANSAATNERSGSPFYTQTVTANFHGRANSKRTQILNLVAGRPRLIVEAFDGTFSYYGFENGLVATVTENQGTAAGDSVGYSVTFTGVESKLPINVLGTGIEDLTITAATL